MTTKKELQFYPFLKNKTGKQQEKLWFYAHGCLPLYVRVHSGFIARWEQKRMLELRMIEICMCCWVPNPYPLQEENVFWPGRWSLQPWFSYFPCVANHHLIRWRIYVLYCLIFIFCLQLFLSVSSYHNFLYVIVI